MKKKIQFVKEIDDYIEDYFNFQFDDIDLHLITKYSPSFQTLSEDNRLHIKSHFNRMLAFLETSLSQIKVPYLQSTFNYFINKLTTQIEKKYFLMFLFVNEKTISTYLKKFFIKLIKIKNFSLDGVIKNQITTEFINSPEFKEFIEVIGEWNNLNEMAMLYFELINKYYEKNFSYNNNSLYEYNLNELSGKNFLKANVLEFGVILLDGYTATNVVNYAKIFSIILSGVSAGTTIICPELQIGTLVVNQLLGKVRSFIQKGQAHMKFTNYIRQINKLNLKLRGLIKNCRNLLITLIKTEFSDWNKSDVGLKMIEDNKAKIKLLCKMLNSFFEEESIDKQILINEFSDFVHKNNMIETNDDWLVMTEVPDYLKKDTLK